MTERIVPFLAAVLGATLVGCIDSWNVSWFRPRPAWQRPCLACHEDVRKGRDLPVVHDPFKGSACADCHIHHKAANINILVRGGGKNLCLECHASTEKEMAARTVHDPVKKGKCSSCHLAHASQAPGLLKEAGADLCKGCHHGIEKEMARKVVHKPFMDAAISRKPSEGTCSTCHAPHGSDHPSLLRAKVNDLCLECHKKEGGPGKVAAPRTKVRSPQAETATPTTETRRHGEPRFFGALHRSRSRSPRRSPRLRASVVASAPAFPDVASPAARLAAGGAAGAGGGKTGAGPGGPDGAKGPGGGDPPPGGEADETGDASPKPLSVAHAGMKVAGKNCISCHLAHGGDRKGLLKPVLHLPFKEGKCNLCHAEKDAVGNPTAVGKPRPAADAIVAQRGAIPPGRDIKLCRKCHHEGKFKPPGEGFHEPVVKGKCRRCHDPHGSNVKGLLTEAQPRLCLGCHKELRKKVLGRGGHKPARKGQCSSCHESHRSPRADLLRAETQDLCYGCHKEEGERFLTGHRHKPVEKGECGSCHDPHGSKHRALGKASNGELCAGCHEGGKLEAPAAATPSAGGALLASAKQAVASGVTPRAAPGAGGEAKVRPASTHEPVKTGQCLACHDPHTSASRPLLRTVQMRDGKLCTACHAEVVADVGRRPVHEPVVEGKCLSCHFGHESPQPHLVKKAKSSELCAPCHKAEARLVGSDRAHTPARKGECGSCHAPHSPPAGGSGAESGLLRVAKGELCRKCHEKEISSYLLGKPHKPVVEGKCAACHDAHTGLKHGAVPGRTKRLCRSCHDKMPDKKADAMAKGHRGMDVSRADCSACHDPHTSEKDHLVRKLVHEPVQKGECASCHVVPSAGRMKSAASEAALCGECHKEEGALAGAGPLAHKPLSEGQCAVCHAAHASKEPKLLKGKQLTVCLACHEDVKKELALPSVHEPAHGGQCVSCHEPHRATKGRPLAREAPGLCLECHKELAREIGWTGGGPKVLPLPPAPSAGEPAGAMEPAGAGDAGAIGEGRSVDEGPAADAGVAVVDAGAAPATVLVAGETPAVADAVAGPATGADAGEPAVVAGPPAIGGIRVPAPSVRPGGEPGVPAAKAPSDGKRPAMKSVHKPLTDGDCDACHASHGSKHAPLLSGPKDTLCVMCHEPDEHLAKSHAGAAPSEGSCLSCHDPHASAREKLVKPVLHKPVAEGKCADCHLVSTIPGEEGKRLRLQRAVPDLCFFCHEDFRGELTSPFAHTPSREGKCRACHEHHVADEKLLLKKPAKALCLECHKEMVDREKWGSVHKPAAEGDCGGCHVAHKAKRRALVRLRPGEKAIKLCTRCHEGFERNHPVAGHPVGEMGEKVRGKKLESDLRCWGCHDPHAAKGPKLVKRGCVQCHAK